jgi:hypothetical protein
VEVAVLGDAASGAAESAGLAALVQRQVEGAVAEPSRTAQDQTCGVVRAGPRRSGGGVTIFRGLVRVLVHALGAAMAGAITAVRVR